MLGTTKPPYTLVLLASLLREAGCEVRLIDQTAENLSATDLIARLEVEKFTPTIVIFCSTTPTLEADAAEMLIFKEHWQVPIFSFGPHASCAPELSMEKAPDIDGMFVGEPEDGVVQLAGLGSLAEADLVPSLTFRRKGEVIPCKSSGTYAGFM